MDEVLEQTLKLACLIRDTEEADGWRKAWNSLADVPFSTPNPISLPLENIPLVDHIVGLRRSDPIQARPLLFLLLVQEYIPHLNFKQLKKQLSQHPEVWSAYQSLMACLALTIQIVSVLRSIGPGYPYQSIVYTLSNTPWRELISAKELPWGMEEPLLYRNSTNARYMGLDRSIPSVSQQLAVSLKNLQEAIRANKIWLNLEKSYKAITRRKNLSQAINETRVKFKKDFGRIDRTNVFPRVWLAKAEEFAQKVYSNRGPRIQAYVESFLEYEELIERVYWLISQLVIYESISCLTSSIPQQLQQVSLGYGKDSILTTLTQTRAETLQVGQLVHIELIETDHVFDGLYQVEEWYEKYQVGTDARALFRARCLWHCQLESLQNAVKEINKQTFIPCKTEDLWGEGGWVDIIGPKGKEDSLPFGSVVRAFELRRTMRL